MTLTSLTVDLPGLGSFLLLWLGHIDEGEGTANYRTDKGEDTESNPILMQRSFRNFRNNASSLIVTVSGTCRTFREESTVIRLVIYFYVIPTINAILWTKIT